MDKKRLVLYTFTASGCAPCREVTKLIEKGKVSNPDIDEIDLVDIGTDEGFARFTKEVLSKNDGAVPSAYLGGEKCKIEILEDNTVFFDCSKADSPSSLEEKLSPPEGDDNKNAS